MGFRKRSGWRPPTSIQQNRLLHAVRMGGYPQAQLNWPIPIRGMRKKRWADIGIVNMKVCIEYDGQKAFAAHFTKAGRIADKQRDAELASMGWRTIRVNKNNWKEFVGNLKAYIEGDRIFVD